MILPAAFAAAALAAEPAPGRGVLTVTASVTPACTIRTPPGGPVVVCGGRVPYVITRPGRPRGRDGRPEGLTITF